MFLILFVLSAMVFYTKANPFGVDGGAAINIEDAPFAAFIDLFFNTGVYYCTGSIISEKCVLTARGCIWRGPAHTLFYATVRVGSASSHQGGKTYDMDSFHPYGYEDAAIIVVDKKIEYTFAVQPIQVSKNPPNDDEIFYGVGWNTFYYGFSIAEGILRGRFIPYFKQEECRKIYQENGMDLEDGYMCAGYSNGGVDVCQTDSGGALTKENTLFGFASKTFDCGHLNIPMMFVDTSKVYSWISEIVEQEGGKLIE